MVHWCLLLLTVSSITLVSLLLLILVSGSTAQQDPLCTDSYAEFESASVGSNDKCKCMSLKWCKLSEHYCNMYVYYLYVHVLYIPACMYEGWSYT